jgi:glycosyltransferase involved in cell wall biosynthesis
MKNSQLVKTFEFLPLRKGATRDLFQFEPPHSGPKIAFISSYPPRECGIATYSKDLIDFLKIKFGDSFTPMICALESDSQQPTFTEEVSHVLNTDHEFSFRHVAAEINQDRRVELVVLQHEFGFFEKNKEAFIALLQKLKKPILLVFHTVLPKPSEELRAYVRLMAEYCDSILVMTHSAQVILVHHYGISMDKIHVIAHGTHLILGENKEALKRKFKVQGRRILATFGLLSSGKSIETTLDALPAVILNHPDVLFLIIGKTHPSIVKQEGEKYREFLIQKIHALGLQNHVKFINDFLATKTLLAYLQITDIYLFTSNDPNQAVSGTFSYAVAAGCPVISTPIPHAMEVLGKEVGMIVDFNQPAQLAEKITSLLVNEPLRHEMSLQALHQMAPTAWENSAIKHMQLFSQMTENRIPIHYKIPEINLSHLKNMTTEIGMIQFAKINQPDVSSGYTLDDNARALIAMCQLYARSGKHEYLTEIQTYLNFIGFCQQADGKFLNYVDEQKQFTPQNKETNLEDSNGRAIWALGFLLAKKDLLPFHMIERAEEMLHRALPNLLGIYSTRSMAFIIKGLHYAYENRESKELLYHIRIFADRLVAMFEFESNPAWAWFESYLTYANSIIPEALLMANMSTGEPIYREIAQKTFRFLLDKTFIHNRIRVISNQFWLVNGQNFTSENEFDIVKGGEQAIDVSYTIMALETFYTEFGELDYLIKMKNSFNWFLGDNELKEIIYNPCTGGCFDGLEAHGVNLNQGAESSISYLLARLVIEPRLNHVKLASSWRRESLVDQIS